MDTFAVKELAHHPAMRLERLNICVPRISIYVILLVIVATNGCIKELLTQQLCLKKELSLLVLNHFNITDMTICYCVASY